ncbi:hypothetical protein M5E84_15220 [[Ruminococcus] torques]|nr:hypothetical protein M5E84_15220 [[Ruminococcus] torques]
MRSIHGQKKVDPAHPEATYYEVKFTGHKIDIYSGKNRMMGKVKYLIDGEEKAEGDLYNATNINSTFITTISDLEEKRTHIKSGGYRGKKCIRNRFGHSDRCR